MDFFEFLYNHNLTLAIKTCINCDLNIKSRFLFSIHIPYLFCDKSYSKHVCSDKLLSIESALKNLCVYMGMYDMLYAKSIDVEFTLEIPDLTITSSVCDNNYVAKVVWENDRLRVK